ncbi:hypothetical protein [Streptomyces phage Verabelle]|uniref:Uncharacterized protein n=1 Tax=Streptomyces phage Verabelle TaxID=3065247 RepID=A0AA50F1A4_9CAUD|nr:hypothetical protein [Streptomyces phage Verabelle]
MGWEPGVYEEAIDGLHAWLAFIEDPESDIDMILAVEEMYGVTV